MAALSFSFTLLALGYVVGAGVATVIIVQIARLRFKRKYHQLFVATGASIVISLVFQIWLSSAADAQTWLALHLPGEISGTLGFGLLVA